MEFSNKNVHYLRVVGHNYDSHPGKVTVNPAVSHRALNMFMLGGSQMQDFPGYLHFTHFLVAISGGVVLTTGDGGTNVVRSAAGAGGGMAETSGLRRAGRSEAGFGRNNRKQTGMKFIV